MKKTILIVKLSLITLFFYVSQANAVSNVKVNVQGNLTNQSQVSEISSSDLKQIKQDGVVLDILGQSIIGATVQVKGSNIGTITDLDGKFSLNVSKGAVLTISYIGYLTQNLVSDGKALAITLEEDSKALDEVVVVGFGTQKKVNLTGAVTAIDDKVFASRPVSSATTMLQGTVPGLNISQTGGTNMNSTPKINVRGITTIGEGSSGSPLVLIDGMEGDLSTINPQDIENISVLKDATSSSIYGSRAPFGVVLVTTKSGKKGKISVNYSNNFRWASAVKYPKVQSSYEYANMLKDATDNTGGGLVIDDEEIAMIYARNVLGKTKYTRANGTVEDLTPSLQLRDPSTGVLIGKWGDGIGYGIDDVDYYDLCLDDNVFSQDHNLSVKGGTEKINYYASANYSQENGLFAFNKEKLNRITTMAKISAKLTDWATLKVTNRFSNKKFDEPTGVNTYSGFWNRFAMWPNEPAYDANGKQFSGGPAFYLQNCGTTETSTYSLSQQFQLQLEPIKNWKTTIDFNYKRDEEEGQTIKQTPYDYGVDGVTAYVVKNDPENYIKESRKSNNYININAFTQYTKTINEDHNFKIMAGFQSEQQRLGNLIVSRNGLIVNDAECLDLTNGLSYSGASATPGIEGNYYDWSTSGFFGRLNYDYKGRYLAEFNYRYDGTSRFRENKRWGSFPSASIGWNIAREDFFEKYLDYIGTFKLRASYGQLGNQNTTSYYPTYSQVDITTNGGKWLINNEKPSIASEPSMIDNNLTWETIKNWNYGLDVSAFDGRLSGSFDYYIRKTEDMVGPAPELPNVFGYTVPKQNNTDLETKGFELMISWRDRLSNGITYGIAATLADSKTEILNYPNDTKSLSTYYSGSTVGDIWGYETIGIAKSQKEMDDHLTVANQSKIGSQWAAGDIMYADLNGDKEINNGSNTANDHGDLKVIGNNNARYHLGFTVDAAWKGFDMRAFFQGVLKRDYFFDAKYSNGYSAATYWGVCQSIWNTQCFSSSLDYYRPDADDVLGQNINSKFARPIYDRTFKNQQSQTRFLEDASYIRFKNLQVGYTLPKQITNNWGISKFRVFVSGENLATFDNLPQQYDPETLDLSRGGIAYPLSKTWSCGVNVTF